MRFRWRSVVTAAVVPAALAAMAAVTLTGCGGGGGGGDPVGAPPAPVGDSAKARTIVLQSADLPQGWRSVAHTEDAAEKDRARRLSACLGRPDPESTRTAIVYGPDLSMDQTQVSSIATVLKTASDAGADLVSVRGPRYGDCVISALREDLQRQAPAARVEDVAAEGLPVESFGDGSVGLRLTASLVYPDHTDKLVADLVYVSKDRATVSATFFSFNAPFPATLEQSLVARMGNRVAAA